MRARDQNLEPISAIGTWGDVLWERVSRKIGVGSVRHRAFLNHRLFSCPQADQYRIFADTDPTSPAIVATREAKKHGGHIAYVMEALGQERLEPLLTSELSRMASRGVEIALVWSYPWSPNSRTLRRADFVPWPDWLRPIHIWFGGTPKIARAERSNEMRQ